MDACRLRGRQTVVPRVAEAPSAVVQRMDGLCGRWPLTASLRRGGRWLAGAGRRPRQEKSDEGGIEAGYYRKPAGKGRGSQEGH